MAVTMYSRPCNPHVFSPLVVRNGSYLPGLARISLAVKLRLISSKSLIGSADRNRYGRTAGRSTRHRGPCFEFSRGRTPIEQISRTDDRIFFFHCTRGIRKECNYELSCVNTGGCQRRWCALSLR